LKICSFTPPREVAKEKHEDKINANHFRAPAERVRDFYF